MVIQGGHHEEVNHPEGGDEESCQAEGDDDSECWHQAVLQDGNSGTDAVGSVCVGSEGLQFYGCLGVMGGVDNVRVVECCLADDCLWKCGMDLLQELHHVMRGELQVTTAKKNREIYDKLIRRDITYK